MRRLSSSPSCAIRTVVAAEGNARLGIADELIKLADLKAKGIITQVEFDAQKAKLLAR
ncbi:SHOCT domain-containing protein [Sphingomonas sp. MMS24-J13]|uniref:SHOCT domain-containing protein n=1 Tax=Sphingomonas sp. MMS24-J13 TaxID=3238686 RepID=UPI00384DF9EF